MGALSYMSLCRVVQFGDEELSSALTRWLAPYREWNLFNPSVLAQGDQVHVAFRAFREGQEVKPFNAYYARFDRAAPNGPPELIDLTAFAADYGASPVADPKLFSDGDRVFVTFNTGFSAVEPNQIFVMQVAPTLEPPQICVLEARHRVEKNWGFYMAAGELCALYSLSPLVRLRLVSGVLAGVGPLVFERVSSDLDARVSFDGGRFFLLAKRNLSLGTQPLYSDGDLTLIGHEKIYLSRFRGYVGRVVRIRDADKPQPSVHVMPERLIHSVPAALPRIGKHNRDALFVTYFSGLTQVDGGMLVGYGINDRSYGFARLPERLFDGPLVNHW